MFIFLSFLINCYCLGSKQASRLQWVACCLSRSNKDADTRVLDSQVDVENVAEKNARLQDL